ncbi:hypothetical protein BDW75DRAFT_226132 [Aspergillus navahoensis]
MRPAILVEVSFSIAGLLKGGWVRYYIGNSWKGRFLRIRYLIHRLLECYPRV